MPNLSSVATYLLQPLPALSYFFVIYLTMEFLSAMESLDDFPIVICQLVKDLTTEWQSHGATGSTSFWAEIHRKALDACQKIRQGLVAEQLSSFDKDINIMLLEFLIIIASNHR